MTQQIVQAIIDRVIQMAWEDRTTFDAIQRQFGLNESAVIRLMRSAMKTSSFKTWRARVTGRKTKHQALRDTQVTRFKSSDQKNRDF
ncbi:TIGR03643 family protein [Undibacterium flavidum]|uniref:TIGR03643 family protein n=1 Tax=Undibacterium flavidum TaxID=2762297 RepID=A0ABR6Y6G4_9BURK|nr:TIGR03643 family protein [Undibacterium flavidum]MBC3872209.1 TIGR03643 family protein [Undibacterium flavidum]